MLKVVDNEIGAGLRDALCRITRDADQVDALHDVLGPFCHESRNILNSLKMSLYLARRNDAGDLAIAWEDVDRCYRDVEHLFERLQSICRPIRLCLVKLPLVLLLEDRRRSWLETFSGRGRTLELIAPARSEVGEYDPQCLGQALDAFVTWRANASDGGVFARLLASAREGQFHLEWSEADADQAETGSTARPSPKSEPLALPLLSRVIAAHGGVMELITPVGRHVRLSWPQTARRPS